MKPGLMAAPITFNTALPIAENEWLFRSQLKYLRSTSALDSDDRELTVWATPQVIIYGLKPRWTLFGAIPYIDKTLELQSGNSMLERSSSGVGDSRLFLRYSLYQDNMRGETLRFAVFGGIEAPTGKEGVSDSLGRLPQPLQPGSGSWDGFGGGVFTWQTLKWQFDASLAYQANTEANNFEFGDEGRFDASYQYRLWPDALKNHTSTFIYGVLESNAAWAGRNTINGRKNPDSGGFTWRLAPGIQYVTQRLILEAAVQLPVVQNRRGQELENDFIVTIGFRINF